ncbi:MAG: 16S rRNA (cytosine(1402)-N(4))-methyltransferase RsmH [Eubacteriales bacterium]
MEEHTHKRRVRYSGTHPKKFSEKYKEHQPEQYGDTIKKVVQKGSTPAGMHLSICVTEIIDFLQIKPGQKGLDATLGYGGHTKAMAKCLEGQGHLYALDVDPIELVKTRERLKQNGYGEEILTVLEENFANLDKVAKTHGKFDFLLADLGVSSMQIDNPERGFSYKIEGLLDLRLNPQKGISAANRLQEIDEGELCGMLRENADEVYAQEIAAELVKQRAKGSRITTTSQLADCIEQVVLSQKDVMCGSKMVQKELVKKSCQRTFQALRIDVNQEFEVLYQFLEKLPDSMEQDGRIVILTFHSGEDRLVKKSFKQLYQAGIYKEIATQVIRPSREECIQNPRARSTKMRWAIKA